MRNNSTEQVDSNAAGGTGISFVDFELVTIQDEYQVDTDLFGKLYPQMGSQAKGFAVLPRYRNYGAFALYGFELDVFDL